MTLKKKGFALKNSARPYNDDKPLKDRLSEEELQLFKNSLKYLTSVNRIHGEIIKMQSAHHVIVSGSGKKDTIQRVRKFLSIIQGGNIPNFKNKYTPCMVVFSETELQKLAEWKDSVNLKKLHLTVGIWGNTIARALKVGYIRRDKYLKIEAFIK